MDQQKAPADDRAADNLHITPAMEDYLKAIFRVAHDGQPVSNQRLAEELGLSGASVSNMLKRLHELHLVVYTPYRPISLTDAGNAVALEVIRHHRLLELFLAQALGMGIDEVHDEADRLEHHVSEELERRIEQALGYPEFDPHGHPIPSRSGDLPDLEDMPLTGLSEGQAAIVSRIDDRDASGLRDINAWNIAPGARIVLLKSDESYIVARVEHSNPVAIPRPMAEGVYVLPAAEPAIS